MVDILLNACKILIKKGVFPYEYINSEKALEETSLPPKENFYSSLKQTNISDEEYEFALQIFKEAKCSNIKDYLEIYLKGDVFQLAEIFENFRKTIFHNYSLDPAQLLTISSLAIQAAMLQNKKKIDLLDDISVITEFESNIRGGLTSVVQGKVTFNNKHLKSFDEKKPISSGSFLDVNSLYATVLSGKLPIGGFYELKQEEIANFDINSIDLYGNYAYALLIDYEIPDDVKIKTDDLPLGIKQEEIGFEDVSSFTKELIEFSGSKFTKQNTRCITQASRKLSYILKLVEIIQKYWIGM